MKAFYITQKYHVNKSCTFLQALLPYIILEPKIKWYSQFTYLQLPYVDIIDCRKLIMALGFLPMA
jgi:hypothetical protein